MQAFLLEDGCVRRASTRAEVQAALQRQTPVWVDLESRTLENDAMLTEDFHLHPLVIEDVWGDRALPKIEDFDEYLYVLVHGLRRTDDPCDVSQLEIDIVFSRHWVVTYHQDSRSIAAVKEELARSARLMKKGPVWVVHAILDHLVDHYVPMLDRYDDLIASLEDEVVAKAGTPDGAEVMDRIFRYRRGIQAIRRTGFLQRDILFRLTRGEFDEIPSDAVPFFRDVYDRFARVTELAEGHRELLAGALEAFLSMQSNRMNEVMKILTLMSTVMLPITFIAGVYGMNFDHMPELRWRYGYAFSLALMAAVALGIVGFFRRRRWI